jgi:hypothetical protein
MRVLVETLGMMCEDHFVPSEYKENLINVKVRDEGRKESAR